MFPLAPLALLLVLIFVFSLFGITLDGAVIWIVSLLTQ